MPWSTAQINKELSDALDREPYSVEYCLKLIEAGADINTKDANGQTAIIKAARHGLVPQITRLLELGADPAGAMVIAAQHGVFPSVVTLIDAKVSVDEKSEDGDTPLIMAAKKGELAIAQVLIDAGADINLANQHGDTALIWSASNNHVDVLNLLIKSGGNIFARDNREMSALEWAEHRGHEESAAILLQEICKHLDRKVHTGIDETCTSAPMPRIKKTPLPRLGEP